MASIVKSVEKVEIVLDASAEPVTQNLSKGQDETQCVPFSSAMWDQFSNQDFNHELCYELQMVDNAGTAAVKALSASRTEADDQRIVVFVVEFDTSINVQQIAVTGYDDATATEIVAVTDVGSLTNAFAIYSHQMGSTNGTDDWGDSAIKVQWNSTTQITLERWATGTNGSANGTLYVVDCDSGEFTVEHASLSVSASTALSTTTAITTVVSADTFLIQSFECNDQNDDIEDAGWMADLQNTTTVRARRSLAGDTVGTSSMNMNVQVIECQNSEWSVQRNDALVLASATQTEDITAIDEAAAIIIGGHLQGHPSYPRDDSTAGDDRQAQGVGLDFLDSDTIRVRRQSGTSTDSEMAYEVIEFDVPSGGTVPRVMHHRKLLGMS